MPSMAALPDPLPPAPDNLRAVLTPRRREGGVTVREVRLEFGPDHRATLFLTDLA